MATCPIAFSLTRPHSLLAATRPFQRAFLSSARTTPISVKPLFIRPPFLTHFSTMAPPPDRRPVVISGPSGVGKGTLYNMLLDRHPEAFCTSVSHTTRNPRPGERDGHDYHYVTMEEFEKLIDEDAFVEHAKFSGNRYGTSKKTVADQTARGRVVVLDIEMEGVKQIQEQQKKKGDFQARYVFISPPSMDTLEARLRGRGTETEASIQKRLEQAKKELAYADTPGVHDKVIVNDNLDKAYKELEDYVFAAPAN